ncbi:hypothetical protein ES705_13680 [subsurface metagenome]
MIKNKKKVLIVVDRYVVKYGRFGAYFYDSETTEQLTLLKVAKILNDYDKMKSVE